MKTLRTFLAAAGLLAVTAATVSAQAVNYTTTGRFTGPTPGCRELSESVTARCTTAAFSLLFQGTAGTNIGSGSVASLGTFLLTATGSQVVPPGTVTFELFVNQTSPSGGAGIFVGTIAGSVTTGPNGNISSLVWAPNQTLNIGPATYTLIFDNIGPGAGRGLGIPINNERGINALVTTNVVPEPATNALLATGLLAIGMYVRRRTTA